MRQKHLKTLSALLALVLLFSAVPLATQAEAFAATFSLTTDKETVQPGKTFIITVSLTQGAINRGSVYVDYDTSTLSANQDNVQFVELGYEATHTAKFFEEGAVCVLAFQQPSDTYGYEDPSLFTLQLTVPEDAADGTEYEISLRTADVVCAQGEDDYETVPVEVTLDPATVKVIVSSEPEDDPIVPSGPTSGTTGDCTWSLDGTLLIISGEGSMADYSVVSPMPWPTSITQVIVQEGVTNIGDSAFLDCSVLTEVTIPTSVTRIGKRAFLNCNQLTVITLPDAVHSVDIWAFSGCNSLTAIVLPINVTYIGDCAFSGCNNLTDVWYQGSESDKTKISIWGENECLTSATWHYNFTGEAITSSQYTVNNGQISQITEGTTVEELLAGIDQGATCEIVRDGILLSKDTPIGTGMVVEGDNDGDGAINAKDALLALQHTVKLKNLQDAYASAADVDESGKIDAKDALLVLQYAVKLIDSFEK